MRLDPLSRTERAQLAELWALRAQNELHAARTFEQVHEAVRLLGAPAAITEQSERAPADERRHHRECLRMAERYDAARAGEVRGPDVADLRFKNCTEREHALLLVTAHCCLSETIAVGYLITCRAECHDDEVGRLLHGFSKDDVRHSRIGWATLALPDLRDSERATLTKAIPELLRAVRRGWLADWERLSTGLVKGHGFIDVPTLTRVVEETLETVVTPGLAMVGVGTAS